MTTNDTSAAAQNWRQEPDKDGLVWLCIDKADASVNVLSGPVLRELDAILKPMTSNPPRGLVVYSGKPSGFIMGADINEFTRIETPEQAYKLIRLGQQVLDRLAALKCPTVAAIDGIAMGGGLELAMACDYRLALKTNKPILGLPEVKLGIHPGFGGTVRAVRIMGVRPALELMLTGNPIRPDKALRLGLLDRIAAPDNWKQAARELVAADGPKASPKLIEKLLNLAPVRPFIAKMTRKQVARRARPEHYPAPYAMVDLWARYGADPSMAYEAEARSIAELMCSETSRNLVRVFFLQNQMKSQGGKASQKVEHVHVVGAGVMGGDIAAWCALRGMSVSLQDREEKYVRPALERAEKLFTKKIRDPDRLRQTKDRLQMDIAAEQVGKADLIIEAIYENLEAKQTLYRELEPKMKPGAILATNTSSIRLEDLNTGLRHPNRLIGLHFFNPVAQLPLVEVIRTASTERSVIDNGLGFVKAIGKSALECASSPGFVVNRVLAPYMAEAMHLHEEGIALAAIDTVAEQFGMPMGPVELVDSVGIDVAYHVSQILGAAYGRPIPSQLARMVENKQLGRKNGQGFYQWENGKAMKPAVQSASLPDDIQDRLMLPLVNEAVACLHEQVVTDADLLDAGVIFGTGFAPFRGGPVHYALQRGIAEVERRLEQFTEQYGERFKPSDGWAALRDQAN